MGERRSAEATERDTDAPRAAAVGAADAILEGILGGSLRLWEDPFVTTGGVTVGPDVVADVALEAFRAKHPEAWSEVVAAIGRGEADGDLALPGGLVVPADLVALIGQVEGIWE